MLRFTDNLISQMTRECNMHCRYCYEINDSSWKGKAMSYDTFKKVLDTYLYYRCVLGRFENRAEVHFHGGEVLTIPFEELRRMIEYLEARQQCFPNLHWCLQTNGVGITDEVASFFAEKGQTIGVSFDGFADNSRMTECQNRALIDKLRGFHEKYGTRFSVLSVLTRDNIRTWFCDMKSISDFVDSFGINIVCVRPEDDAIIPTPEEQWEYWMKPVIDSFIEGNPIDERGVRFAIMKIAQQLLFDSDIAEHDKTGCFDRICGYESNMTAIDPDLMLSSCDKFIERGDYIEKRIKHPITERDFLGLQQANRTIKHYLKMYELEHERGCDLCQARWICPGECQAYNISKYGSQKLDDSMCSIYRRAYDYVDENLEEILLNNRIRISGKVNAVLPSAIRRLGKAGLSIKYDPETGMLTTAAKER